MIVAIYMNVVKGNYTKENNMATQMVDLQKLKAIILERVIEHLQEEANGLESANAEFLLGFIGDLMIEELLKNKEKG